MVEVNNQVVVVAGATANTFELGTTNTTGYTTWTSGGLAQGLQGAPASGTSIDVNGARSLTVRVYNKSSAGKTATVNFQCYSNVKPQPSDWNSTNQAIQGWDATGDIYTATTTAASGWKTYVREVGSNWNSFCVVPYTSSGTAGDVSIEIEVGE